MDKETIRNIIYRLGMYVNPINEITIISFIHGYETGLKNTILTDQISSHLTEKYKIAKPAVGFSYQINVYSENHEISWVEGFVKIVEEVLQLN